MRLRQGRGGGLVADHRQTSLQRGLRGGQMHMVGRGDRHEINAILAYGFLSDHRGDVGIGAGRIDAIASPAARDFSALLEKAPATSSISRSISAAAVHRADEGPRPAADQSHA
jgi:hypothetical protein